MQKTYNYNDIYSDSVVISIRIGGGKAEQFEHKSRARVVVIDMGDKMVMPSDKYDEMALWLNQRCNPSVLFIYGCDKLRCDFLALGLSDALMKIQHTAIGVRVITAQTNSPSFPSKKDLSRIKSSAIECFTLSYALCSE